MRPPRDKHELRKKIAGKQSEKRHAIIDKAKASDKEDLSRGWGIVCYRTGRIVRI